MINLSGKGPKASQEEGAVEPEGGWPVEPEWPNPAEQQFVEGDNYLHICRVRLPQPGSALSQMGCQDPDEITSMLQSTRSLDLDTDVMVPDGTNCLLCAEQCALGICSACSRIPES